MYYRHPKKHPFVSTPYKKQDRKTLVYRIRAKQKYLKNKTALALACSQDHNNKCKPLCQANSTSYRCALMPTADIAFNRVITSIFLKKTATSYNSYNRKSFYAFVPAHRAPLCQWRMAFVGNPLTTKTEISLRHRKIEPS